jgi:histidyl-tRNA synthetase
MRLEAAQFIRKASDVASSYGFRAAQTLDKELPRGQKLLITGARNFERVAGACVTCLATRAGLALPGVVLSEAMLCFHTNPNPTDVPAGFTSKNVAEFGVEIVGSQGSIGEIVALKTMLSILADTGGKVRAVRIGSAGDRDSQARFARELGVYLKKRANDIGECCHESSAHDPLSILRCKETTCVAIVNEGPRAMAYLSEKSRTHFKEVLEYLERTDMPYELDERLVHDEKMPRVLFSLDLEGDPEDNFVVAAHGGRYDDYIRRITGKKDATAVRANLYFRKKGTNNSTFTFNNKERNAKIYFVKLGIEAALKSLTVLDALRKAHIPVYQSFSADKLAPQLSEAERLKVPTLIIMGQREAMQDAVIVRRVETRSQHIVRIPELPQFLRTI